MCGFVLHHRLGFGRRRCRPCFCFRRRYRSVVGCFVHKVSLARGGIDGSVAFIEQLDGEVAERSVIAAKCARFLQRRLPLGRFDAQLDGRFGAAPDRRDFHEPTHRPSIWRPRLVPRRAKRAPICTSLGSAGQRDRPRISTLGRRFFARSSTASAMIAEQDRVKEPSCLPPRTIRLARPNLSMRQVTSRQSPMCLGPRSSWTR